MDPSELFSLLWSLRWGFACLSVLCLTAWDREALPWALSIAVAVWLNLLLFFSVGQEAYNYGPLLSLALTGATTWLFFRDPTQWKAAVCGVAAAMLLADLWLFLSDALGVYVGQTYDTLMVLGLGAQLMLMGHRGALNAGLAFVSWVPCYTGGLRGHGPAAARFGEKT